jgi:hypothetical protein
VHIDPKLYIKCPLGHCISLEFFVYIFLQTLNLLARMCICLHTSMSCVSKEVRDDWFDGRDDITIIEVTINLSDHFGCH